MLNLPFDKWTLRFYSSDYEKLYEEHQNEIRLHSFQLINILVTIATLVCLIILLIQRQSNLLIIMVACNIAGNFSLSLLNKKLKPYMKYIFSSMYVAATASLALINFSDIEIPHYALGHTAGCLAFCIIQHSDNRLKIVYLILTPTAHLAVFNVFKLATLEFVVYAYACMIFIGTLIYRNEYTSRMAFALMLFTKKQKDIIYEYVSDTFLAVGFIERTGQFNLEFQNKRCEEEFCISETEQLKIFLRTSFLSSKQYQDSKKQPTLEEFLFKIMKEKTDFLTQDVEIRYEQHQTSKILTLQIKIIDFGKPVMLLTIKQDQTKQNDKQGELRQYYQQIILDQSKQFSDNQIKLYNQIKKTRLIDYRHQLLLQCLNLHIINLARNYIIYFNRGRIYNQIGRIEKCNFRNYFSTLEDYFYTLSEYFHVGFEVLNTIDYELKINLNTKYLTQIVINIFTQIVQRALRNKKITLQVMEEPILNPLCRRNTQSRLESLQRVEQSQQPNLKLISFTFCYLTDCKNKRNYPTGQQNNNPQNLIEIEEAVTQILLDILGPYNNGNQISSTFIHEQGYNVANKIQFFIYSDQSLLEQSFIKHVQDKN